MNERIFDFFLCLVTQLNEAQGNVSNGYAVSFSSHSLFDSIVAVSTASNTLASCLNNLFFGVIIVLLIIAGVLIFNLKREYTRQAKLIKKYGLVLDEIKEILEQRTNGIAKPRYTLLDLQDEDPKQKMPFFKRLNSTIRVGDSIEVSETETNEHAVLKNKSVVKYADFYIEGDVPSVENRDLSDVSQDGMFIITIKSDGVSASYTVNPAKYSTILQDILAFSKYVEICKNSPSAKSVKVESDGLMSRNGAYWRVTTKMRVKLF